MKKIKLCSLMLLIMAIFCSFSFAKNSFVYAGSIKYDMQTNILAENSENPDDNGSDGDSENNDSTETPGDENLEDNEKPEDDSNKFVDGAQITSNTITDDKLYSGLLDKLEELGYKGSTIYANSFVDFTELNLSTLGISSIEGLGSINFKNLKTLNLSGNIIENIDNEMLSTMPNLENLDLSGNKLKTIDLSQMQTLVDINLMANKLTELNIGNLRVDTLNVNISGNNFTQMSDITMPTRIIKMHLNVIGNNITQIEDDYFNWDKLTLYAGIQGFKSDEIVKIAKSNPFKVYKTNIANCEIKIFKKNGLNNDLVETFKDGDIEGDYKEYSLAIGEYTYEYWKDGAVIYKPNDEKFNIPNSIYKGYSFMVIPNAPTYLLEYKGKTYESLQKVTGTVKVNLSSEEGVIMYSVNGGEWTEGKEIKCDGGGNYSVKAKVVYTDGDDIFESELTEVFVKTSLNSMISDGLMLALVLLLTLTLFLVVVPIVSKKYFKK